MERVFIGNTGIETSRFGLGCMRLPLEIQPDGSADGAKIDEPKAIEMIRHAIDHGADYVDTAHGYHGGNSKTLLGKALLDGYRERAVVVSKLPPWDVKTPSDFDRLLNEHLEALQTDYLDIWLLHALNKDTWQQLLGQGILEHLDKIKAEGKVRAVGFSFHDELDVFKAIIDSYDWDVCQIQLNILDVRHQAGLEGLHYAAERGIPVVIMEPLKGGKLAGHIPSDIQDHWDRAEVKRSPQEWAFRWLANMPEVTVVLSGASTLEQLQDSLQIFETVGVGQMTADEERLVAEIRAVYESWEKVGCTACDYCMPCPFGVNIPGIFRVYNTASMYDDWEQGRREYAKIVLDGNGQELCTECGACEEACPQHLSIIEDLREAHVALS